MLLLLLLSRLTQWPWWVARHRRIEEVEKRKPRERKEGTESFSVAATVENDGKRGGGKTRELKGPKRAATIRNTTTTK